MRTFKKLTLLSIVTLLSCSLLSSTAVAEFVILRFKGEAQATIGGTFFNNAAFEIAVSIDDSTPDRFDAFFQQNIGVFDGATTTVSFPDAGILNAQSTNATTITQQDFGGSSQFELVSPSNVFNPVLRVGFNTPDVFPDVNSLNPLVDPQSSVTSFSSGGLDFLFANDRRIQINSITSLVLDSSTSSGLSASIPEPTSLMMFGMGLLAVSMRRRRR